MGQLVLGQLVLGQLVLGQLVWCCARRLATVVGRAQTIECSGDPVERPPDETGGAGAETRQMGAPQAEPTCLIDVEAGAAPRVRRVAEHDVGELVRLLRIGRCHRRAG